MRKFLSSFEMMKAAYTRGNLPLVTMDEVITCKPFVLSGHKTIVDGFSLDKGEETNLDAPFPLFSIEAEDEPLFKFSTTTKDGIDKVTHDVFCLIVKEITPKQYDFIMFCSSDFSGPSIGEPESGIALMLCPSHLSRLLPESEKANVKNCCNNFLKKFLDTLDACHTGHIETKERVKYRLDTGKQQHTFTQCIYIRPNTQAKSDATVMGRYVDWSYRFSVRGHWRILNGKLGKDRAGNYNVENFTWISEHVRGPENAPLVMKQRIL